LTQKERIHTRSLTVNSYEMGDGTIRIEGVLTDERFFPSLYYSHNQFIDPGIVHKMTVPIDSCREIEAFAQKLVGLKIRPGFTRKVRGLLGGVEGCLHLTNLILTMGSAALQGFWAYYSRRREGAKGVRAPEFDPDLLKDSCWMWREEGPLFTRIRELQEDKGKAGETVE
jgi:hypothetical protein